MKNKYISVSLIIAALFFGTGCDDFLDETPDNRTTIDSKEKITKLLVSAYPTSTYCYLAELSSDNTDNNGSTWSPFNRLQTQTFAWDDITEVDTDSPQSLWDGCYLAIASANLALEAIEELGDPETLTAQKGEALLCRAYSHFVLVNIFGKHYNALTSKTDLGVPYIEAPETTVSPKYKRLTVAEVYEKINTDIETALPLIKDDIYSVPKYHFNKKAAYAFATRFNLYYCNYDNVITYSAKVLGSNPSSVLRDWEYAGSLSANDNYQGDEFISKDNRAALMLISTYSLWGRISGPYSAGSKYCHNKTISSHETTGSTGTWGSYSSFYCKYASYSGIPKVIIRKMNEYFEYTDVVNGIGFTHIIHPVFTTDETLLCRAEAYVHKKDYENATNDLATFQDAFTSAATLTRENINSFYSGISYYTPELPTVKKKLNPDFIVEEGEQENFIQCILHMRRILTIHEGLRWFDIKRYGIEIFRRTVENNTITVTDELTVNDPRRAIQLPHDVITAGMTANPR
ncbi:MAG: RagB/SusD family nutrient uptake outer membrane protein [Bacteroidales bacterium]|nr:RagB/SusD family nutrient uptake outer membrane protein [Bacteroidales bacterium]